MTQVSLNKVVEEIEKILQKWKYDSIELFLTDSKSGKIRNAEDDAIVIQNLLDDQEELHQIKNRIHSVQ
ncbi:MAG: hypothetical protein ACTSWX_03635 [Promethearchaeota archaeon]